MKQSPTSNKRIEIAALANLSCANGVLFESILRAADPQNSFHTAKVIGGRSTPCRQRQLRDMNRKCLHLLSASSPAPDLGWRRHDASEVPLAALARHGFDAMCRSGDFGRGDVKMISRVGTYASNGIPNCATSPEALPTGCLGLGRGRPVPAFCIGFSSSLATHGKDRWRNARLNFA